MSEQIPRLIIAGGNIRYGHESQPINIVVTRPPIEEVLQKDQIQELERRGYLPKDRRISNLEPKATVFEVFQARNVAGDLQRNPSNAAFNIYHLVKNVFQAEVQVDLLIGDTAIRDIYRADI